MDVDLLIYEQGLTFRRMAGEWMLLNLGGGTSAAVDNPVSLAARYGLRPIVAGGMNGTSYFTSLLVPDNRFAFFFVGTNQLQATLFSDAARFEQGQSVVYLLNALEHHCQTLAHRYAANCAEYSRHFDKDGESSEFANFGGDRSIYYEFDALITGVRRTYDALRYIIWRHFGSAGSCPRSFHRTYPKCLRLPKELLDRLAQSWETIGSRSTAYRDCLQHYVPVTRPLASQFMHRLHEGQWTCRALIPDNPEAQSQRSFRFSRQVDALTYGWDASHEVQQVALAIGQHLPSRS